MSDINKLSIPAVPHFPNGGMQYEQRYQNELNNILRLYLDRLNGSVQSLVAPTTGGRFLSFPFIAASDTTDQYATGNNTPTQIAWNTLEAGAGFTLNNDGTATPDQTGTYKITYSLQFANTANAVHDAVVWLRINGVDIPRSATYFSIPARKSAGVPSYICGYSEVVFPINGNDDVALYWATDLAYSTTGPIEGVYVFADPAQTVPYARPAIPSAIGSITFLSASV